MKHLANAGETTVTIEKFEKLDPPQEERSKEDLVLIFLDVETTGLSFDSDRIIQLCFRPVLVNRESYKVTAIAKSKVFHNDPGFPLSEEIQKLTGLQDEDLSGESIDWEWIAQNIKRSDFVVCHNANFDRGMLEGEFRRANINPAEIDTIWGCSMNQVYWRDFCRPSKALEVISAWTGFFYDAHQAANDVDAMIHVLRKNKKLSELLKSAILPDYRVFAMNSPRDKNPELKKRRYRWDPNVSCWYKNFSDSELANSELDWLKSLSDSIDPQLFEIEAKYRFSAE